MGGEKSPWKQGLDWRVVVLENAREDPDASRAVQRADLSGAFKAEELIEASGVKALMVHIGVALGNRVPPETGLVRRANR
jgi:hypothetical protein